jgi:hypothetical protein
MKKIKDFSDQEKITLMRMAEKEREWREETIPAIKGIAVMLGIWFIGFIIGSVITNDKI